jgi:hypothetical protein
VHPLSVLLKLAPLKLARVARIALVIAYRPE